MTKVCHMTSAHTSQDVRIMKKQCQSLAKEGFDTYLVAKGESYCENGVQVVGIGEISCSRLTRMIKVTKLVYKKAIEVDADIYQIHDPELLPYALKLKKKGKKVVFDSHENYNLQIREKSYIPKFLRNIIAFAFSKYQDKVLKKIDGAIFPCLKDDKHIFDGKCKNIITLGNEPLLDELYNKYDHLFIKTNKSVCYIGGLSYDRGIKHLIEATHKANAKLILGGTFQPKIFEDEMRATQCFNNVDYRGFVNRNQVLEIYNQSKIGICTILSVGQYNYYDNFATKVYEYMSVGLPVIMSDYKFAREVNEKYNFAILVDPEDIDQISNAITYILDNPEIAKEMGQNGRQAIKEEFNWSIEGQKLFKLYEEIV